MTFRRWNHDFSYGWYVNVWRFQFQYLVKKKDYPLF